MGRVPAAPGLPTNVSQLPPQQRSPLQCALYLVPGFLWSRSCSSALLGRTTPGYSEHCGNSRPQLGRLRPPACPAYTPGFPEKLGSSQTHLPRASNRKLERAAGAGSVLSTPPRLASPTEHPSSHDGPVQVPGKEGEDSLSFVKRR